MPRPGDHLRIAAGLGRKICPGEDVGHHEHPVHRGPDFVGHRREKVGFGAVGLFGRVFGHQEFARAIGNVGFQARLVLEQALIPLADILHHVAEGLGQDPDLVVAPDIHLMIVGMAVPDAVHHAGQPKERHRQGSCICNEIAMPRSRASPAPAKADSATERSLDLTSAVPLTS